MNLKYFPNFVRVNYKDIDFSDEALIEVGQEFKKYLEKKFEGKMEKLEPIWAIEPKDIIPNINHPFYTNGYSPGLIIHFGNFLKEMYESQKVK